MNGQKVSSRPTNGQPEKSYEDRRGWAACFPPRNPKSKHPPNFVGVMVIDKKKFWVSVWLKTASNGNLFASVRIAPWKDGRGVRLVSLEVSKTFRAMGAIQPLAIPLNR
jgi:hypothetical protein